MLLFNRLFLQCATCVYLIATASLAGSEGVAISPQDWRALTAGKTVYYSIDGEPYGREFYVSGTNLIFFEHSDGTCLSGTWSYDAPWYSFKFTYDGYQLPPHRFRHQKTGDIIHIISDESDLPNQQVYRIAFAPFSCNEDATS